MVEAFSGHPAARKLDLTRTMGVERWQAWR
jgi:hypothetical protein